MKNSYILLRNNVESSSLQLEDLQKIGIKPTDLFWVECQSVCWQSPTEINELKNLIEEHQVQKTSNNLNDKIKNEVENYNSSDSKIINKKLVFVELPAGEKSIETKILPVENTDAVIVHMNKYANPDNKTIKLNPKSDLSFEELNEKHIASANKNNELEKTFLGIELPGNIKRIALYTCLIAAGAILMLLIMSNDRKNKIVFQTAIQQPEQNVAVVNSTETEVEEAILPISENVEQLEYKPINNPEIPKATQKTTAATSNNNYPLKVINEKKGVDKPNIEKKQNSIEPIKDIKESKKVAVENISAKLILKANDFEMGSFGGIKNLEITLENNSEYLLDKVTVNIKFLNPEGNTVNSEIIYFESINPGEATTIPVKKSKRGVKIDYKITKIESKQIFFDNSKFTQSYSVVQAVLDEGIIQ